MYSRVSSVIGIVFFRIRVRLLVFSLVIIGMFSLLVLISGVSVVVVIVSISVVWMFVRVEGSVVGYFRCYSCLCLLRFRLWVVFCIFLGMFCRFRIMLCVIGSSV